MSLDMYAVGTALATQYGTVTAPASMGGTVIRGSTIETPNNVQVFPYIVIELPSGELPVGGGQRRAVHEFPVYFLFSRASGDTPRNKKALLQWLGPLLDATFTATKLGLSSVVMKALPNSYEPVIYEYGDIGYHAWRFVVGVWTEDTVTLVP
jgi:hypothetical protein